jgi:hypothetical protein
MPPTHTTEGLQAAQVIRRELAGPAFIPVGAPEVERAMGLPVSGRGSVTCPRTGSGVEDLTPLRAAPARMR